MDNTNVLETISGYSNPLNSNTSFNFDDFSQISNLKLNGTAKQISNTLDLNGASPARSQAGSAFLNNSVNLDSSTNFSTHFQSQISGTTGLTFMLQNDSRGTSALGDPGGSFGYGNMTYGQNNQISQSVAIELSNLQNSWDVNNNHVALLINGDVMNTKTIASPQFSLGSGGKIDTWVDYNAKSKNLSVYLSNTTIKPTAALLSSTIDLTQVLGNQFYTGFSAGSVKQNGANTLTDNINNWNFSAYSNTSTPGDSIGPTATLSASNIIQSSYKDYTFTVTYQDQSAVKTSTIDSQDIQVTGPNGFTQLATFKSLTTNALYSTVTATYSLNAPGGSWNIVDDGTYTFSLLAKQVTDIYDNSNATNSTLGTFVVNINQDVLTQRNDASRSGIDLNETILNTSNVNQNQFGKLFQLSVDGQIYAQPLYVSNVNIPGQGVHNVVYVATMHNTIYAFDADNPSATTPLWTDTIGNAVQLPDNLIGGGVGYNDISKEVGILSTPVIDGDTKTMYVVNMQKVNDQYSYLLHAIDITTGQDKIAPVTINASVAGTGEGSQNGVVPFLTSQELQRTALLLANGNIYIAFASFGDSEPYHGWVLSYDATTLQQKAVYNNTPNGGEGGIWQSGTGLSTDQQGNIYLISGNGTVNPDGSALGESFIKLNANLQVTDWFTPYNYDYLNTYDKDLGTGNVTFIPGTNLVVGIGKEGKLYVVDSTNMGHSANNNTQVVQSFPILRTGYNFSTPSFDTSIYWNTPSNGGRLYVSSLNDVVKAYSFNGSTFDTTPLTATAGFSTFPGSFMSLSSNGNQADTGILWSLSNRGGGTLTALDAVTLNPLWSSNDNLASDKVESLAKFNRPTIANGKVYLATFSNVLDVYGLLS